LKSKIEQICVQKNWTKKIWRILKIGQKSDENLTKIERTILPNSTKQKNLQNLKK
jgi:hypothetical protein